MEQTFLKLAHLFVQTLPTVLFVFILFLVLDRLFFRPFTQILQEREQKTRGALERAREQMSLAEARTAQYEAALQAARMEIYPQREAARQSALAQRAQTLHAAREQAESLVRQARHEIEEQARAAKQHLAVVSRSLAEQIADAILRV